MGRQAEEKGSESPPNRGDSVITHGRGRVGRSSREGGGGGGRDTGRGERPMGETEAETENRKVKPTLRDGVGDTTDTETQEAWWGRSRGKMRRRRNGVRGKTKAWTGDGLSNRQREERLEDQPRMRQTHRQRDRRQPQGKAGRRGRDSQTGCCRTDKSRRDTEAVGRLGSNGVRELGRVQGWGGRGGAGWDGVLAFRARGYGAGTELRRATPLPGKREEREASQMLRHLGVPQLMVRTALAYRRKEGTARRQGRSRPTDPGSQGDLSGLWG